MAPATPAANYAMTSVPEAQATILQHTQALPAVNVPLHDAQGRVLAADVHARDALPPYRASIKARGPPPRGRLADVVHLQQVPQHDPGAGRLCCEVHRRGWGVCSGV